MSEITLEVSRRETTGKGFAKKLRRDGKVPAIVYGAHRDAVSITVEEKALTDLLRKSDHGIRSVFLLHLAGSDQKRHAMIKDVQMDPITLRMRHVDFVRVLMDETVRVAVPIHVKGTAEGVKLGGILDFQVRELHIECLPNEIPDEIVVDVSALDVGHVRRVSDLVLPPGIKVEEDMERVVVSVQGRMEEEEEEAEEIEEEEEEAMEPEVLKKGKAETEEE